MKLPIAILAGGLGKRLDKITRNGLTGRKVLNELEEIHKKLAKLVRKSLEIARFSRYG